jgi:hypothetical protein
VLSSKCCCCWLLAAAAAGCCCWARGLPRSVHLRAAPMVSNRGDSFVVRCQPALRASAWSHHLRGARLLTVAAAVATTRARRVREQLWVCIPITALYLVLIFGGQAYMRDRPAWDVRRSLICWNWLCSIFSLIGALRVVPHALSVPLPLPPRKWSTVLPPSRVIPASKVVDH